MFKDDNNHQSLKTNFMAQTIKKKNFYTGETSQKNIMIADEI